ncbi:hypothetical protein ACIPMW_00020 [Streptomyces sp. NPDC086669]|uniref:hypothetical protein n=1 Tax=Streptomyces sp. NPDC086669 TaxID=3365753 RepID=UPI003804BB09
MSKSSHSTHRDLKAALQQSAKRAGESSPSVRGSDWRLATVTAVATDGTLTADGITVRRMETYQAPAVGDVIAITQSSSGNWLGWGRTAGPAAPNGAWTTLPLLAGFTSPHAAGFGLAQYRVINAYGTARVEMKGTVGCNTALTAQTNATPALPAEARPSASRRLVLGRTYSATALGAVAAEMTSGGVLSVFGSTSPSTGFFSLDGIYYDI